MVFRPYFYLNPIDLVLFYSHIVPILVPVNGNERENHFRWLASTNLSAVRQALPGSAKRGRSANL